MAKMSVVRCVVVDSIMPDGTAARTSQSSLRLSVTGGSPSSAISAAAPAPRRNHAQAATAASSTM